MVVPLKKGGMNLPSHFPLKAPSDVPLEPAANVLRHCVQHFAMKCFEYSLNLSRKKFKDALAEDSDQKRKSFVSAVDRLTQQADDARAEES